MFDRKECDYQKICLFCENASILKGGDLLCKFNGVVSENYSCRKFVYDPLKRRPSPKPKLPSFRED